MNIERSWELLVGDCKTLLPTLPAGYFHTCVTSPPYYGLRSYSTERWEGGDLSKQPCEHRRPGSMERSSRPNPAGQKIGSNAANSLHKAQDNGKYIYREECPLCGARRVDEQLGMEGTPEQFVASLVDVFREVRRVLRDDGTLFLNLGDSYWGGKGKSGYELPHEAEARRRGGGTIQGPRNVPGYMEMRPTDGKHATIKPKDLMMMPARVALALQTDGWYLRSDIIWAKRSPMPESVTDRPTSSYEHIFLFSKGEHYYYDPDAVREPSSDRTRPRGHMHMVPKTALAEEGTRNSPSFLEGTWGETTDRNQRNYWLLADDEITEFFQFLQWKGSARQPTMNDVWELSSEPYLGAHFATFPPEVPRRAIAAGTSAHGVCQVCGSPWKRLVEVGGGSTGRSWHDHDGDLERGNHKGGSRNDNGPYERRTVGWAPTCKCTGTTGVVPATVLDPFAGVCTTLMQAQRMGRSSVGLELSPKYAEMGRQRIERDSRSMNMIMMLEDQEDQDSAESAETEEEAEAAI